MANVHYAKAVPEVKFNAVEPGCTNTEIGTGNGGGRPAGVSAKVVGPDGPTGTFQEEEADQLPW
ncbi:hypothetical protein [Amycolatopsis saalfeldensis]|uniref:hypothetical protein n=1 Tax=Amycolatopsis saalfeldensis TaxID=394193 RepID=UPI001FE6E8C8|nr:hypothetical protein [Amycolatopsis saalfeldensis]